ELGSGRLLPVALQWTLVWVLPLVICAAVLLQLVINAGWLIPAPDGDSALFLAVSANYCQTGFFGSTAFDIDPSGQSRMVWHGFVSPLLYGAINPRCEPAVFYVTFWVIKVLSLAGVWLLGRARNLPHLSRHGLILFALAAQTYIGFRPETLAIFLIIAAELVQVWRQYTLLGAVMGALLCTQPTVAALHGLVLLLTRPPLLKEW